MIVLELTWEEAAAGAGCLGAGALALRQRSQRRPDERRLAVAAGFVRETALVLGLFALWQLAGSYSVLGPDGALGRARWLWHAERVLRLPSEASLQHGFLSDRTIVQASNLYYDVLHFPVLICCMIWLFAAHRESYPRFRTSLVAFTAVCLLIQLIPVAPPRMLPGIGMVDTAAQYGQSVYTSHAGFNPDQLSAMPSVHVGWAILVAVAVIGAARTPWRWLALLYPVLTTLVVVVTANHFWLDGIVAAVLLGAVMSVQGTVRRLRTARAEQRAGQPGAVPADRVSVLRRALADRQTLALGADLTYSPGDHRALSTSSRRS